MNAPIIISGSSGSLSGGKGGSVSARAPTEQADSLRSRQYARMVLVMGEGPVGGLVDGFKSIYLDGTPIQNADGTYNFTGVTAEQRGGYPNQSYIAGFSAAESETAVGSEVKVATPLVRTITDENLDAVRVTIGIPALTYQMPTTGDLIGGEVVIAIDLQSNGGGYQTLVQDRIAGKTTTRYQRAYRVPLINDPPWDIRVRRISGDSTTAYQNRTWWDSYTQINEVKLRRPNSYVLALQVDASQFQNIPTVAFDSWGRIISVPVNYDPIARTYTGGWDGSFKQAWTDNPAWCFYDLITNARFGLGEYIDAALVDKWALYAIGQYCDALVPDGFGGVEPRFRCNLYLQTADEAFKVVADMAAIFRGMVYWGAGGVNFSQDSPSGASALYTQANVTDGTFNYEGSSLRARHTVALVSWNDPENLYQQTVEYVEDAEGIARYGVVQTQVAAMGCTSRGQAHRVGKWLLTTERLEAETVTFEAGLDHALVHPGSVIEIMDAARGGARFGGRVISSTTTVVNLDSAISMKSGVAYLLNVVLPDGTINEQYVVPAAGTVTSLTVPVAFPAAPQSQAMWVVRQYEFDVTYWRVISVQESARNKAVITALRHEPQKYGIVENNLKLEPRNYTLLKPGFQAPVTSVTISESLYLDKAGQVSVRVSIAWVPAQAASSYRVEYQVNGGNWQRLPDVRGQLAEVLGAEEGTWIARVTALSALGTPSQAYTSLPTAVLGKTAPPPDVDGFLVSIQADGTRQFTWQILNPPLDLDGVKIRHRAGLDWTWNQMQDLHTGFLRSSPYETNMLPAGVRTFAIKAYDTSGNPSVNARYIEADLPDPRLAGALEVFDEYQQGWPQAKYGCHIEPESGFLQPNESAPFPWLTNWTSKWIVDPVDTIVYERLVDIGVKVTFTPVVSVDADGAISTYERHSDDGVTYTSNTATGAPITARYVVIGVSATIVNGWPMLRNVVTILAAQVVNEFINDLNTASLTGSYRIGTGDIRLPINNDYALIRRVAITLQNITNANEWGWTLIDKDTTVGPRIRIYHSGALADATIDADIGGIP